MLIDPSALTLIQTTFIEHLSHAFPAVIHYALNLLYIFAIFEVVVFGLVYALGHNASWGNLFFKIIKIALIFFIVQNFAWLLDVIIKSFAQIGGVVAGGNHLEQFIFNPAKIWQFGYDFSLSLLKMAAVGDGGFGLTIIFVMLGLGILLVFGLLGIQIVLQITSFYLISLIVLIFLPLGVFIPSVNMFDKAVQSVLRAGVRVAVLIMVIGIAITVWHSSGLTNLPLNYNINLPLGIFFTALLFLFLAIKLPAWASEAVGQININARREEGASTTALMREPSFAQSASPMGELSAIRAATTIEPGIQAASSYATMQSASITTAATGGVSPVAQTQLASGMSASPMMQTQKEKSELTRASRVEKSVSEEVLRKILAAKKHSNRV